MLIVATIWQILEYSSHLYRPEGNVSLIFARILYTCKVDIQR